MRRRLPRLPVAPAFLLAAALVGSIPASARADALIRRVGGLAHLDAAGALTSVVDTASESLLVASPDGRSFSYVASRSGSRDTLVIVRGASRRRITLVDPVQATVWSASGARLAAVGDRSVVLVDTISGGVRVVRLPTGPGTIVRTVRWAHDGSRLVVLAGGRAFIVARTGSVIRLAPTAVEVDQAVFSPNSRRIAYAAVLGGHRSSVYVATASGSGAKRVPTKAAWGSTIGPGWAADSSDLAVSSHGVQIFSALGGNPVRPFKTDVSVISAVWSPRGHELILQSSGGPLGTWRWTRAHGLHRIVPLVAWAVSYSPDARHLVMTYRNATRSVTPTGSSVLPIDIGGAGVSVDTGIDSEWSSDSSRVFGTRRGSGEAAVYSFRTGKVVGLGTLQPRWWAPDSRHLIAVSPADTWVIVDVVTGARTEIAAETTVDGIARSLVWASGRPVATVRQSRLVLMRDDGSGPAGAEAEGSAMLRGPVSHDGSRVAYTEAPPGTGVFVAPVSGGPPTPIQVRPGRILAWSADDTMLTDGLYEASADGTGAWVVAPPDVLSPDLRHAVRITGSPPVLSTFRGPSVMIFLSMSSVAWAPDSSRVAFLASRPDGGSDLDVATVADGSIVTVGILPAGGAPRSPIAWSPDGLRIALAAEVGWVAAAGTADSLVPFTAALTGSTSARRVVWSPDSTHLALAGSDPLGQTSTFGAYLAAADGTGQVELAVSGGRTIAASWSPDARTLIVATIDPELVVRQHAFSATGVDRGLVVSGGLPLSADPTATWLTTTTGLTLGPEPTFFDVSGTPRKHVLVPSMVSASIVGVSADHDRVFVSDGAMLVRVTLSTGAVLELGNAGVVSAG